MLRHKEGVSFVDMEDILLIQREERSTVLYLAGGERLVTSDSLSELDERLPDDMFFRTHKSYVVGLRHIDSITPYGRWTYVVSCRGTDARRAGDRGAAGDFAKDVRIALETQ